MTITLLDGREMEVYPNKKQPEKIERNKLQLDITGKYLSIGKRDLYKPDETILERGPASFHSYIFWKNA